MSASRSTVVRIVNLKRQKKTNVGVLGARIPSAALNAFPLLTAVRNKQGQD
jgi:hypothetical protein